jgi:F-type H+-transporting ATPase subunit delta
MSNLSSIARPYALAAFDCARDQQQLSEWKDFLESASLLIQQKDVARLLANPELSSAKLFDFIHDILALQSHPSLNKERKNFLSVLAQNKRMNVLPDIADTFNAYYAALEKITKIRLVTAIAAQEEFKQQLVNVLTKRIQSKITLDCEIDPSILGGAIVHIGDKVIDGSIRGKLTRLLNNLID